MKEFLEKSELGKQSTYDPHYNAEKLFAIPRQPKRVELGISEHNLPFIGFDHWHHYEVSCLNSKGKPLVFVAEIVYPCDSPFLIESKSMKLYFNSLNNTVFENIATLQKTIATDIEKKVQAPTIIKLFTLTEFAQQKNQGNFHGTCLDELDVACHYYTVAPEFLSTQSNEIEECVYSDLLKSNCPMTDQPDWGSVQIAYKGKQINHEGLLKYLVSFRNHNEFHEQCIERIFIDIWQHCQPQELSVHGCYTRRGGLDINPYRYGGINIQPHRSTSFEFPKTNRLCRQ